MKNPRLNISGDAFVVETAADKGWGQQVGPSVLVNFHAPEKCAGRPCVVHDPSDHHMITWPLNWRGDKQMMERICFHGIGHPDPDDLAYQKSIGKNWAAIHGCDGCCSTK